VDRAFRDTSRLSSFGPEKTMTRTRISAAILLTGALFAATPASAQVAQLNAWPTASTSNPGAGNFSVNAGDITVSAGTQRLLVVAAVFESGAGGTLTNFNATLGGTALTAVASTDTTQREVAKVWYLLDAQVPAGAAALVVSGTYNQNVSGLHIYWASFSGVSQTAPIVSASANYNGSTNVTFGAAVNYVAGGRTFCVAGNGGTGVTETVPAGFAENSRTSGTGLTSVVADDGGEAVGGSYPAATSIAFTGATNRSVVVVASLRPSGRATRRASACMSRATARMPRT